MKRWKTRDIQQGCRIRRPRNKNFNANLLILNHTLHKPQIWSIESFYIFSHFYNNNFNHMTLLHTHLFPKKMAKNKFYYPILIKVFNLARKHFNFARLGGSYMFELQLLNYQCLTFATFELLMSYFHMNLETSSSPQL